MTEPAGEPYYTCGHSYREPGCGWPCCGFPDRPEDLRAATEDAESSCGE